MDKNELEKHLNLIKALPAVISLIGLCIGPFIDYKLKSYIESQNSLTTQVSLLQLKVADCRQDTSANLESITQINNRLSIVESKGKVE